MAYDPGSIALANFELTASMLKLLLRKNVLTNEEGLQVWRDAVASNAVGTRASTAEIEAILKQAAPEGLFGS